MASQIPLIIDAGQVRRIAAAEDLVTPGGYSICPKPNILLNGTMEVDQRNEGASVALAAMSGTSNYGVDRWAAWLSSITNTASTQRRVASSLAQFPYCLRVGRNSGQTGTGKINLAQVLKSSNSAQCQGKTVQISFWARKGADYSSASNALNFTLATGTGTDQTLASFAAGTWTGYSASSPVAATLTTSWQRFSSTLFSVGIGSSATQLGVLFDYTPSGTAGAADYFEITGIKLENGDCATDYLFEEDTDTIRKCQHYWEKSTGPGVLVTTQDFGSMAYMTGSTQSSNAPVAISAPFKVPKRNGSGTLTTYDLAASPAAGKVRKFTAGGVDNATSAGNNISSTGFNVSVAAQASLYGLAFNWSYDNEL